MPKRKTAFLAQFAVYCRLRLVICALLAFSSGFSVLLIVCTVPIWLKDHGISKTVIGWFIVTYLPYVLKIFWAPFIDMVSLPYMGRWFGHLRGWAFTMQGAALICVLLLAWINPAEHLIMAGLCVSCVAFFSATRDIVTDAYRVEILQPDEIAPGSAMYLFGYRIGMLTSSAGSLFLADYLPWDLVYLVLASTLMVGLVTIWFIPEPKVDRSSYVVRDPNKQLLVDLGNRLKAAMELPIAELIKRRGWILMVALIPIYKLGDNFVQSMSNIFFLEIGFSKTDIASTVKVFGLIASILGSLWGGIIVAKIGDIRAMFINGIIHTLSFSLFVLQAWVGDNILFLYLTIAVTHVTGGIVTTAFVSYISHLCHPSYRVTQYALFSSLRSLDKCLTAPAGWLADNMRWSTYFMVTPLLGIPALIILAYLLSRQAISAWFPGFKHVRSANSNA